MESTWDFIRIKHHASVHNFSSELKGVKLLCLSLIASPGTWSASMSLPRFEGFLVGSKMVWEKIPAWYSSVRNDLQKRRPNRQGKESVLGRWKHQDIPCLRLFASIEFWNISPREAALINGSLPANLAWPAISISLPPGFDLVVHESQRTSLSIIPSNAWMLQAQANSWSFFG